MLSSLTRGRRQDSGMVCDARPGSCCHDGTRTCLCDGHDVTGAFCREIKVHVTSYVTPIIYRLFEIVLLLQMVYFVIISFVLVGCKDNFLIYCSRVVTGQTIGTVITMSPICRVPTGQPICRVPTGQPIFRSVTGQPID